MTLEAQTVIVFLVTFGVFATFGVLTLLLGPITPTAHAISGR